jgi:hypothetical protein
MRRFALTICAVILGAGFTPALPSTVEPPAPAPISFSATARPAQQSTVDVARPDEAAAPAPAVPAFALVVALHDGRPTGPVAGRSPPAPLA